MFRRVCGPRWRPGSARRRRGARSSWSVVVPAAIRSAIHASRSDGCMLRSGRSPRWGRISESRYERSRAFVGSLSATRPAIHCSATVLNSTRPARGSTHSPRSSFTSSLLSHRCASILRSNVRERHRLSSPWYRARYRPLSRRSIVARAMTALLPMSASYPSTIRAATDAKSRRVLLCDDAVSRRVLRERSHRLDDETPRAGPANRSRVQLASPTSVGCADCRIQGASGCAIWFWVVGNLVQFALGRRNDRVSTRRTIRSRRCFTHWHRRPGRSAAIGDRHRGRHQSSGLH